MGQAITTLQGGGASVPNERLNACVSYISSYFYCVFSTKDRRPIIKPELSERLGTFLGGIARQNNIRVIGAGNNDVAGRRFGVIIPVRRLVMSIRFYIWLCVFSAVLGGDARLCAAAADEASFQTSVLPFLKTYCIDCHGGEKPKAKFDLGGYSDLASVVGDPGHWELVLERLKFGEMPPEDEQQPSSKERKAIIDWIETLRRQEAERNAGDPGIVLARRLSNAEYDYTIRDLMGVNIRPTREFPVDPANEAGFDNSGESLTLSPALLKKYLSAARRISEHLILKSDGLEFAAHPAVTNTDRDRFCVSRIIDFYRRHETDLAAYFQVAWRFKHREALGMADITMEKLGQESGVSAKYLQTVWELLSGSKFDRGSVAKVRKAWRDLPAAGDVEMSELRRRCENLRDRVHELRAPLSPQFAHLRLGRRTIHPGAQAFVYWRNRQNASHRRSLNRAALNLEGLDAEERVRKIAANERFCSVFPNAFYISERGREFLDPDEKPEKLEKRQKIEKGRLLSAGLHSQLGYFRDDTPLSELILNGDERRELDALWLDLDVVALAAIRQHKSLVWFERTDSSFMRSEEFDFARAEDHDVVSAAKIKRLSEVYLAKALELGVDVNGAKAIRQHFRIINEEIRRLERARVKAEPGHLRALLDFAGRAYRRPLTNTERGDLMTFYKTLRTGEKASHEDALRDLVVSVLMSPHFWYRVDLPAAETGVHSLSDYALASRLSYFLWSSMPDRELLAAAARGELQTADGLLAQTRRMIKDERIRGLALEFGGNWLDFRRFENHNSVDRKRFPTFDDELRQSMFEEPVRFFVNLARTDRSILDFLFADYVVVNSALAQHYGVTAPALEEGQWTRVNSAWSIQRGGLLPMAVFQTQNAPGLRTSPVKRGYWVVRRLLGEHIPPPPPDVPDLPSDEGVGDLTVRQRLARHREDPNCAACHQKFDAIGLAFEGYGPIGELRSRDLGDRPVDTRAVFPGGSEEREGLAGLKTYLKQRRQDEFVENLCRKMLSYALSRKLMLSDTATLATMRDELKAKGHRFSAVIETIVSSPQFRNQRGRQDLTQR